MERGGGNKGYGELGGGQKRMGRGGDNAGSRRKLPNKTKRYSQRDKRKYCIPKIAKLADY